MPVVYFEHLRLRLVNANGKPCEPANTDPILLKLKMHVDGFFIFTPFDLTDGTYVAKETIGDKNHIIELSRQDLPDYYWCKDWKKTAIHTITLTICFFVFKNKKIGFVFAFVYLMLPPLLSVLLAKTDRSLYDSLNATRYDS
ncbi:MAG: hypothetical protein K940chlam8_00852, partial [Chlamydiae bacterium]|nr:hypothetical protein [Chlamydiota bacterium]